MTGLGMEGRRARKKVVWGLAEQLAQELQPPLGQLCLSAQVLDLSHNDLSFVPPDLPEALEELHLQSNRIGYVGPEAFLSTPSLRVLFLRCPQGGWVGPDGQGRAMVGCGGPQEGQGKSGWLWPPTLALALMPASWSRANKLHMTSIAPQAFLGLPHLRMVDTTGNPEQVLIQLPPTAPHRPQAGGP